MLDEYAVKSFEEDVAYHSKLMQGTKRRSYFKNSALTKRKLIWACAELLARNERPRVSRICEIAMVSSPMLRTYFGSQKGLCRATLKANPYLVERLLNDFNELSREDRALGLVLGRGSV